MPPLSDDGNKLPWSSSITLFACSISCQNKHIKIILIMWLNWGLAKNQMPANNMGFNI